VESQDEALRIYLNDHFAGSRAGVDLARRARDNASDPERRATWQEILEEVETDREILRRMINRLGFRPNPVKAILAWAGEKSSRLKAVGWSGGPSELGQLFELELMHLGVTGKLSLWMNLAVAEYPGLREFYLDELIARAESQRDRLEDHRVSLSAELFGRSGTVA
jgi:hypothetical protein